MPGLSTVIAAAVRMASTITDSTQATITHEPILKDANGDPIPDGPFGEFKYGPPETLKAIVEDDATPIWSGTGGVVVLAQAKVTILAPVAVHTQDRITLPGGRLGPVLRVKALLDNAGEPYLTEVWLGSRAARS